MTQGMKHGYALLLFMALMAIGGCKPEAANNSLQQKRQEVEDSIVAGYNHEAMKSINRHLAAARDSDTYYLWLSSRNKGLYAEMQIDSMRITTTRIGRYLERQTDRRGKNIDHLRADFFMAEAIYQSAILCRPDSGLFYINQTIDLLRQRVKNQDQLLTALTNKADFYRQMGKMDLSADTYLQALALADSMQAGPSARIAVMLGISTAYTFMADYKNSNLWWQRTAKMLPHMQSSDQFIFYNNRGNDYYLQGLHRQALPFFLKAGQIVKGKPNRAWDYYTVQANLGEVYTCLGQSAQAHQALNQADSFFRKVEFHIGLYYTDTSRIGLAMLDGKHTQALRLARQQQQQDYMIPAAKVQRLKTCEATFKALGLDKEAYEAHLQMHALNDSIQTANTQMRMNTNLLQYRHDKQLAEQQHIIDHQRFMGLLAWGLLLLAVLILLVLTVLVLLHRRRRQMRDMEARHQMIKLRMENTRNRISPHFIYNALNHEMLAQMNGHEVNLHTLTQLLRRGVDRADALMTTLKEEIEFVGYYVSIEAQQMGDNFRFATHVGDNVDLHAVRLPAMMVQIFAENAIKHGLRPIKDNRERHLDISITRQGGRATRIEVTDNGVGLQGGSINEHTGMRVVRQTIQLLNEHNKEKIIFGVSNYTNPENGQTGCQSWIVVPDEYSYDL